MFSTGVGCSNQRAVLTCPSVLCPKDKALDIEQLYLYLGRKNKQQDNLKDKTKQDKEQQHQKQRQQQQKQKNRERNLFIKNIE